MPVTAEQFDTARRSAITRASSEIASFLRAHSELAYSFQELLDAFKLDPITTEEALLDLEGEHIIESRILRDELYFCAVESSV